MRRDGCCSAGRLGGTFLQGQIDEKALAGLEVRPQIAVSISQRSRVVTAPLDIYVQVTNLTKSDVFVKNIRVLMPGAFIAARGDLAAEGIVVELGSQQLKPGYQRLVPIPIPQQQLSWLTPVRNRQLLTFIPGEYDVNVVVTYNVPPEPDSQTIQIAKITLRATPKQSDLGRSGGRGAAGVIYGRVRLFTPRIIPQGLGITEEGRDDFCSRSHLR